MNFNYNIALMDCIINTFCTGKSNRDYSLLSLDGKPVLFYSIDCAIEAKIFDSIYVNTTNDYAKYLVENCYKNNIQIVSEIPYCNDICVLSSCAPFLKPETLRKAYKLFKDGSYIEVISSVHDNYYKTWTQAENMQIKKNIFCFKSFDKKKNGFLSYLLSNCESVLLDNDLTFELAIALINKISNKKNLHEQIQRRIQEKKDVLNSDSSNTICLVGHSQFDLWDVDCLCDKKVQNCGICGISSFEYNDLILKKDLLYTNASIIVVIHGTNDIVYPVSIDKMVQSIKNNVTQISQKFPGSKIFLLKCLHVNGRLDRNNNYIDELNQLMDEKIDNVELINVNTFDDPFGNLKPEYTCDGLHLSEEGYMVMKDLLERSIKDYV